MKKSWILLMFFAIVLFACNSNRTDTEKTTEQKNENKGVNDDVSKFVTEVASASMAEVQLGQMAANKAENNEVKTFGQEMVTDHSKANDELKSLASSKNISIPPALTDDDQKKVNKLQDKAGKDFDEDYMDMMVDDHEKVVDKFKDASTNLSDADVKAWASKTLPTLQHHLDMARQIKDNLKNNKKKS
jgi:putative membrane protein